MSRCRRCLVPLPAQKTGRKRYWCSPQCKRPRRVERPIREARDLSAGQIDVIYAAAYQAIRKGHLTMEQIWTQPYRSEVVE